MNCNTVDKHCVYEWIGLRTKCEGFSPLTGLYLEDFPGLSRVESSKTTGFEHESVEKMLKLQLMQGWKRMVTDFQLGLRSARTAEFQPVQDSATIGAFTGEWIGVDQPVARGIRIYKDDLCGGIGLKIRSISFRAKEDSLVELSVSDSIDTFTAVFQLTAGQRYKHLIDWNIKSNYTYVTVSGAIFEDTDIYDNCFFQCCGKDNLDKYFTAHSYNPDSAISQNCSASGSGVSLDVIASCDFDSMLCPFSADLGRAVWYAAAISVLEYRILTSRMNSQTVNKEETSSQIELIDVEYKKEISKAVGNLGAYLIKTNYNCFNCNQFKVRYASM